MANHKSAKKRDRQSIVRQARNKAATSRVRSAIKGLRLAVDSKNKEEATQMLTKVQGLLGRLSKSSAMRKDTAARRTSRLALSVNKLA
ncbi:30S ribosomal protein S20 [Bacteriovoracaceae bacterium]|nr:30S ribosomal protein S20 [Bacteriovoracaceae bacterium]